MSTAAPALLPDVSVSPTDLSRGQRGWLVVIVVLAHALIAFVALTHAVLPAKVVETPAIEVALISNEAPPVAPVVPMPVPAQPKAMPEMRPRPTPPMRSSTPPVLASAKPAQPNDIQVAATPVNESKPVSQPAPTTPTPPVPQATVASAPPAPSTESGRQAAQPIALPSSALRYLVKPEIIYPRVSRDLGESGRVQLQVLIDEQGHPVNVGVAKSSGFPRLDQEAVRAMKAARFQPRIVDGAARAVSTLAPFEFNLEEH